MEKAQDERGLQNEINNLYPMPLAKAEADDAARNLVGLFEILLEIQNEEGVGHGKC